MGRPRGTPSCRFLAAALWIIEGFDPHTRQFELTIKLGAKIPDARHEIEAVLRRHRVQGELRSASEEQVSPRRSRRRTITITTTTASADFVALGGAPAL